MRCCGSGAAHAWQACLPAKKPCPILPLPPLCCAELQQRGSARAVQTCRHAPRLFPPRLAVLNPACAAARLSPPHTQMAAKAERLKRAELRAEILDVAREERRRALERQSAHWVTPQVGRDKEGAFSVMPRRCGPLLSCRAHLRPSCSRPVSAALRRAAAVWGAAAAQRAVLAPVRRPSRANIIQITTHHTTNQINRLLRPPPFLGCRRWKPALQRPSAILCRCTPSRLQRQLRQPGEPRQQAVALGSSNGIGRGLAT